MNLTGYRTAARVRRARTESLTDLIAGWLMVIVVGVLIGIALAGGF